MPMRPVHHPCGPGLHPSAHEVNGIVNLDRLILSHQLAKRNAKASRSSVDRRTYFDLVDYFAKRIARWERDHGVSETAWLRDERTIDRLSGGAFKDGNPSAH